MKAMNPLKVREKIKLNQRKSNLLPIIEKITKKYQKSKVVTEEKNY